MELQSKKRSNRTIDRTKQRFGRLTVQEDSGKRGSDGSIIWKCFCDCGNTAFVSSNELRTGDTKSCGCIRKKMCHARTGANNPGWKGGITPERIKVENTLKYKVWRQQIFERDNYTCQFCRERGGKLNAHHIFSYAKYPNLRLYPLNGITFCESCHQKLHKIIGK